MMMVRMRTKQTDGGVCTTRLLVDVGDDDDVYAHKHPFDLVFKLWNNKVWMGGSCTNKQTGAWRMLG